jgi:hypothetical protein
VRPLIAAAACVLLAAPARAWSIRGHQIVALIAEKKLAQESPETLAAVRKLLSFGLAPSQAAPSMAQVAACADMVRMGFPSNCGGIHLEGDRGSSGWHFVNIPITDENPSVEKYCGGNCVLEAVKNQFATLQDPSASPRAKQVALIYMVHFVGDMHQPLHCAFGIWPNKHTHVTGNDYGGNEEEGKFMGTKQSLHQVWDHLIEPKDLLDPQETADALGPGTGGTADEVLSGKAALESFEIARTNIYPKFNNGSGAPFGDPGQDDAYQQAEQQSVFDRLQLGGARLAALLEQALAPAPLAAGKKAPKGA